MIDRSKDVSDELTEVRTVLSRAESAIGRIRYCNNRKTMIDTSSYPYTEVLYIHDPDVDDMIAALQDVVAGLERWRKRGKKPR